MYQAERVLLSNGNFVNLLSLIILFRIYLSAYKYTNL